MLELQKYELAGFQLKDKIYESNLSVIYKGINIKEQLPVIIKFHKADFLTKRELEKIDFEYHLLQHLDIPGVIKVYSLENFGNNKAIVMEDFDAVSLDTYLRNHPLSLKEQPP